MDRITLVRAGLLPPELPDLRKRSRATKKIVSFVNGGDKHSVTTTYVGTSGEMSFSGALMIFESVSGALMQADMNEADLHLLRREQLGHLLK